MQKTPIDHINIIVSEDDNGLIFSLKLNDQEIIKQNLGGTPRKSLYVGSSTKGDFELLYGSLLPHIIPALFNLENRDDYRYINRVNFVTPYPYEILESVPNRGLNLLEYLDGW